MTRLVIILCLVALVEPAMAWTFFWATPNNPPTSGNGSGSDANNPMWLGDVLNLHDNPDTWVWLLDGTYDPSKQQTYTPLGTFQNHNTSISQAHPMVVAAVNQYKAIICGGNTNFGNGSGIGPGTSTGFVTPGMQYIGLQVCSNQVDGISLANYGVISNCWIHDNGQQGANLSSPHSYSNTVCFNIFERNGSDTVSNPGHYHNIYIVGTGNLIFNNIFRKAISGRNIQIYSPYPIDTPGTNDLVFNNLSYGAVNFAQGNDCWNGAIHEGPPLVMDQQGDNYWFNNTMDSIVIEGGSWHATNNICFDEVGRTLWQFGAYGTLHVLSDYNVGTSRLNGDPHEVVTTMALLSFVNSTNGLYWLKAGSAARNVALAGIDLKDFLGSNIVTGVDAGFQPYTNTLAADVRNLDTGSGTVPPPYWANIVTCNPPVITVQPQSQTVTEHANVTFTIATTGDTPQNFYWNWNGGIDQAGPSTTYTAYNVLLSDSGARVTCYASNACAKVLSATAIVTVTPAAPTITVQPQSQTVFAGQNATFNVTATGLGLNYQWTFNGSNVGANSSSYTRSGCLQSDDQGKVQVNVSNASGSVNSTLANLTVVPTYAGAVLVTGHLTVTGKVTIK